MASKKPVLIMVAPNGARRTKADHSALPITPDELAQTAVECRAAGAGAIHLHVRDEQERHSLAVGRYVEAVKAVKAATPGMAIQVTTEAAGMCKVDDQEHLLAEFQPAFASISIAEILRDGEERGIRILRSAIAAGTRIQYILYSPDDIRTLAHLRRRIRDDDREPSTLLVAGRYGVVDHATADIVYGLHRVHHAEGLDAEGRWMTCAFGRGELSCLEAAISLGSHARVGFENAIVDSQGKLVGNNAERVSQVADLVRAAGHLPAKPKIAGGILG